MHDTFYIIDLMLFSLSWFVLLPDYLSCYDYVLFCTPYTCFHVCHLYLWSGVLFSVYVLYFKSTFVVL